ncbi:DUF1295 domain-containing protein [Pandoraea oxalativorans]|uniref:Uncharacterized protein n=1 Tax=Pandoraea oxalativorans TaxID=573737 RepID=A0A0E3YEU0_9BURK|nr:DUF1295 domain-containing protein [Pandoraea oxalativorans]AKC70746.1 hypothetical protein MB84_16545 [Pandoraea oxalativorans]
MRSTVVMTFCGMIFAFALAWVLQKRTKNACMVDPIWAAALSLAAIFVATQGTGNALNRIFVGVAGGLWGARLSLHLWRRNWGKVEDARYRVFRERWGAKADRNMFWFFQFQGVIAMLLAVAFFLPSFSAQAASSPSVIAAVLIWACAVVGEASADRQLRDFGSDPTHRAQVCRKGLWRYSRHPNYFFECLHWCSYAALCIAMPWGWVTLFPPLFMAWLLLKVSGIPLLEAHLMATRPAYREYMQSTSALVPWPPKPARRTTSS